MSSLVGRDLISIRDLSCEEILTILELAKQMKSAAPPSSLQGKILATCFFEPSTRTRLSFEAAMHRLGGKVIGFSGKEGSSMAKGETLYDTIRVVGQYADIVVIRHPVEGAARLAAEATTTPVINAGDGANQHPTQALLDLFTMQECLGTLEGKSVAIVGDLRFGRAVHSLVEAASSFDMRLYFVAPPALEIPKKICDELRHRGTRFSFHQELAQVVDKVDLLYMTRLQKERFEGEDIRTGGWCLSVEMLKKAKDSLKILHPLPRNEEIPQEIDELPYAHYFQQAENGLYLRQALLASILAPQ